MREQIIQFLRGISLKKSNHLVRKMVADHFDGVTTSNNRYVKIGDVEYRIRKNPDNLDGWDVEEMKWETGNNWKFASPY